MKLVSFGNPGMERVGVVNERGIVDVTRIDPSLPATMRDVLAQQFIDRIETIADDADDEFILDPDSVRLGPPVTNPSKIICVGLNYRDHAAEQGKEPPEFPLLFSKGPNVLCGHGDTVPYPAGVEQFDYEAEMAVVIGKVAYQVPQDTAFEFIAGYMAFNDLTARDLQYRERQWFRAKSVDGGGPSGPWLVTSDEIEDPHALDISLKVNGEELQSSNTREMTFTTDFLVHYISQTMTLEPGDIIATGTPPGVGVHRRPQRFLQRGDRITTVIERLGALTVTIG